MNCWELLGIEQSGDESVIKEAYLKKLPQFHPEDNPEGFRLLRQALEEALKSAKEMQKEREAGEEGIKNTQMMDSREIRVLLKDTENLYRDYGRRIQPEEWKNLLSCPVCQDLENQKEAGWAMLGFFMDHPYIPHGCYAVLEENFGWLDAEEELKGHFPEGFVEYLIERIEEEDSFRYDRFEMREDFDYDQFIRLYLRMRTALREKNREEAEGALQALEEMEMDHPDLTMLKIRHLSMIRGMEQETWEMAKELFETDRENPAVRYWYVQSALAYPESEAVPEVLTEVIFSLLNEEEENAGYWQLFGSLLRSQGKLDQALSAYQKAKAYFDEEWEYLENQIADTARELSFQIENEEIEPWNLANLCWMARRYDKVRELLEKVTPSAEEERTWLMMMAESCHHLEDYPAALEYRKHIWDTYGEEERPLGLYMHLAESYELTNQNQEALAVYRQAAEHFPSEQEIYFRQAKLRAEDGAKKEAVSLCDETLKLGFHREAFNLRLELLLELKQFGQVIEDAESVMKQGYQSAQVLYDYAKALRGLEDYARAEEILKKLYQQTDGSEMVSQEYASLCGELERYEEALDWIDKALEKRDTPLRQFMKAGYLHELDRFQEEALIYRMMLERGLDDYYTYYRLGGALESEGKFAEAEQSYRISVEKNPSYGSAWDGLGDALQKQGKWEEAANAYKKGWECGSRQAARDFCRILKRTHQDEMAVEYLEKAVKEYPDDSSLMLIYSTVLKRRKEYDRAVKCLNRYIEIRPSQTARGYKEIALCYEKAEDWEKTEEYYQKAIDQEPDNGRYWRLFGKYWSNTRKEQEKALPYLEKAAELEPDSGYGWMKLGEVYEELGRGSEAVECYKKSLKQHLADLEDDPTDSCNYEGAADVLVHLGCFEEAEAMAHKAIELQCQVFTCNCPFCYEGYEDLAKLEEKRGNLKKALEWMELAGRMSSTDYYPREIARLKEAVSFQEA